MSEPRIDAVRSIHLDAVGGIAGDMFVAALLDAFPQLQSRVLDDTAAVIPEGIGRAELIVGTSGGMRVMRFGLAGGGTASAPRESLHSRSSAHSHGHGRNDHDHGHHHAADIVVAKPTEASKAPSARFPDLVARICAPKLHEGTAQQAVAILTILAEAEARVHGVPIESVHFHEIADWDSLLDVVAAGSIAAALAGAEWTVSPLPLGGGLVRTQHGLLPVPAPATSVLLKGFAWREDGIDGERVTPTGAAILRHLVTEPMAERGIGVLEGSGVGAGTRHLAGMPNILRATLFAAAQGTNSDDVIVISFEVDDMTGEEIGIAADRLRATVGVLDLSIGTRAGKKSRPMNEFRLIVQPSSFDAAVTACLSETSTIGLRYHTEQRRLLPRFAEIDSTGQRRVKRAVRPDGTETRKIESDDLKEIPTLATRRKVALSQERG